MTSQLDRAVELLERSLAHTRVVLHDLEAALPSRPGLLRAPTPCTAWDLEALLAHLADSLDAFTEAAGGRVEMARPPGAGGSQDPGGPAQTSPPGAPWCGPTADPVGQVRDVRRRADLLLTAWVARADAVRSGGHGGGRPPSAPADATPGDPARPARPVRPVRPVESVGSTDTAGSVGPEGTVVGGDPEGPGDGAEVVAVADRSLGVATVVAAAALEVAVHGWDVARAAGLDRTLPDALAADLLPVARACVGPADRGPRFAPSPTTGSAPVSGPVSGPGARPVGRRSGPATATLMAHLGRDLTGPLREEPRPGDTNPGERPPPDRRAS
ncbi:maleylpyruvate isomerase N-terminal domain-containing protein [Nocardioides sp. Leaf374]|uniref:maleylpyruvate isomerase N-terminal domain-containing protein n=1 Tax=Nocardioides sp. Leaf374 TaxID=2876560 RepID=UPI001E425973|nr:hypothetical protein [Nocardioides sp. Leaf374]